MYLTPTQRRRRVFLHWETWVAFLLGGGCGALGSHVGEQFFGHPGLFAGIGGALGGYVMYLGTRYVERHYYPTTS